MIITSKTNSTIARFSRMKERKERDKTGKYLIEGYRAVKDSLPYISGAELLLSEIANDKMGSEFSDLPVTVCTDFVFSSVSDTETAQGILCIADKQNREKNYDAPYALFLDRVRDPGNVGTMIRTALAAGFDEIYCRDCVDPFNPKVVRSAASAVARVNIHICGAEEIAALKEHGYTVVCADMNGKNAFETPINGEKLCLAIGNEANGLDKAISTMSDIVLSIPMRAGESLNAAVSASILMYRLATAVKQ